MKGSGQNFIIIACEWEQLKGHYEAVASFKHPYGSWDGMHLTALWGTRIFLNPQRGDVQAIKKLLTFVLDTWNVRTRSLHAPKSGFSNTV
jgi:hypothetical protein